MKELHVVPESNLGHIAAIADDTDAGRFVAQLAVASLSREEGEEYVVVECDDEGPEAGKE